MVIDELVVVLGLDPRKFNEGQRQAMDAFKKGKDAAADFGNTVEASANKMSEALGVARKGAIGIVGALVGGEVAAFVGHVVAMDAATGRMAKTIGTSVTNLSAWQYMVRQVGGEASSATSALSTLQQEIENVRQGGGMFEGGFASLMNQAGVSLRDDADTSLRKIQSFIAGQITSGRMRPEEAATFLRRVPGMNEDMINLMLADFQKIERAARATGTATDETAKAAQRLQGQFSLMIQAMERFGASLIPIMDFMMKPPSEITREDLGKLGFNDLFIRGGLMDKLDRYIWGDHNLEDAKKRLADGLRARASGVGPGGRSSASDREAWIRASAAEAGIDPDVAMRVARSEGFGGFTGDNGTSFGDFQLHLSARGNAVGDAFRKATGLDPSDPANEQAMDAFALRWAAAHGWGDFHGAARVGVGQFQGIGARASASARAQRSGSTSTTTNDVDIHKIEIHAPNATDAEGLSHEIGGALKKQSLIAPVNNALV